MGSSDTEEALEPTLEGFLDQLKQEIAKRHESIPSRMSAASIMRDAANELAKRQAEFLQSKYNEGKLEESYRRIFRKIGAPLPALDVHHATRVILIMMTESLKDYRKALLLCADELAQSAKTDAEIVKILGDIIEPIDHRLAEQDATG